MAMNAKIITLYEDSEKEVAIAPRTTANAVSTADGANVESAISNINSSVNSLQGALTTLDSTVDGISNSVDGLQGALTTLDSTVDEISNSVEGLATALGATLPVIKAYGASYDMTTILTSGKHCAIYLVDGNTLGTVTAEGGTTYSYGAILSFASSASYGSQFAFMNGTIPYFRRNSNGTISNWKKVYTGESVIPIENGGTGASTASAALTNLGVTSALTNKVDKSAFSLSGTTLTITL